MEELHSDRYYRSRHLRTALDLRRRSIDRRNLRSQLRCRCGRRHRSLSTWRRACRRSQRSSQRRVGPLSLEVIRVGNHRQSKRSVLNQSLDSQDRVEKGSCVVVRRSECGMDQVAPAIACLAAPCRTKNLGSGLLQLFHPCHRRLFSTFYINSKQRQSSHFVRDLFCENPRMRYSVHKD